MANEDENGRRPSIGYDRSGRPFVRGQRSRPGAPMADPTQNKGAIDVGRSSMAGTPDGIWDEMFRNRVTGETPSSLAAKRSGITPAEPAPVANMGPALAEAGRSQFGFDQEPFKFTLGGPDPTLSPQSSSPATAFTPPATLAPIGQKPASPTIRNFKSGGANWSDLRVPGVGTKRTVQSQYGWGSSYFNT